MAFASPHVTAIAVEATEFPDLARTYRVSLIWPADKADPALQGASASLTLVFTALAGTSA